MKYISKIVFVIILSLTIVSCSEEETIKESQNSFTDIELLKTDARYSDLIESEINLMNNVVDFDKAKLLTEKSSLSANELSELSIALGFKSKEQYQDYINTQKLILRNLNNEYNLESIDKSKLIDIGIQSLNLKENNLSAKSSGCNCERIRRNCIIEVGAAAIVGHFGCASVDWTGIGAPICHGAVIVIQIAASDNCNANAENCENDCND